MSSVLSSIRESKRRAARFTAESLSERRHGGTLEGSLQRVREREQALRIGVRSSSYVRGRDVLETVASVVQPDGAARVHRLDIRGANVRVNLITEAGSEEVVPSDVVFRGLKLTHSLVDEYPTRVQGFLLRMVCLNGLTDEDASTQLAAARALTPALVSSPAELPASALVLARVREQALCAWRRLEQRIADLRVMAQREAEFEAEAQAWLRHGQLEPGRLMPMLRAAWQSDGEPPTGFGLLNAFTCVATHVDHLSTRQRQTLESLASRIASGGGVPVEASHWLGRLAGLASARLRGHGFSIATP
ncbi:MAG: hypothetical protein MJD61_08610 [Proteobacteria bacterium]|nr:hypothetical protein [Pseudomonadota bacterium]